MLLHQTKTFAVITGASSGIGAEIARLLARHGYNCILVARREDRLRELCEELNADEYSDGNASYICADLKKRTGCDALMTALEGKDVEVFVNNAGFGDCSEFINGDVDKELDMIDLNIKSVHYLTKKMLKKMSGRTYGYILNTASSAGLLPGGPYMATYYATKAYVVSLTRAIAQELKESESRLYIGALCPGPVDTEFNKNANVEFALPGISASECAKLALDGMFRKKTIIVPGLKLRIACLGSRIMPVGMVMKMVSHQQKKKIYV